MLMCVADCIGDRDRSSYGFLVQFSELSSHSSIGSMVVLRSLVMDASLKSWDRNRDYDNDGEGSRPLKLEGIVGMGDN